MAKLQNSLFNCDLPIVSSKDGVAEIRSIRVIVHRDSMDAQYEVLTGQMAQVSGYWWFHRNQVVDGSVLEIHTNLQPRRHELSTGNKLVGGECIAPWSNFASRLLKTLFLFRIINKQSLTLSERALAAEAEEGNRLLRLAESKEVLENLLFDGFDVKVARSIISAHEKQKKTQLQAAVQRSKEAVEKLTPL